MKCHLNKIIPCLTSCCYDSEIIAMKAINSFLKKKCFAIEQLKQTLVKEKNHEACQSGLQILNLVSTSLMQYFSVHI